MNKFSVYIAAFISIIFMCSLAFAGDITGMVKYQGAPPRSKMLKPNKDTHVCGTAEQQSEELIVGDNNSLKNAVVYIEKAHKKAKPQKAELDQKQCTFTPHVLVTTVGSNLTLANSDPLMHNIHIYCLKNSPFNESIPKGASPLPKKLLFPEEIKVVCDVHKWMSAWIIVRDNPYYGITDANGKYTIKGVPKGNYKLIVWHELLGKKTVDVNISGAAVATQNFELAGK